MNWRTTGILFVIVVILAGAVYLQSRQNESEAMIPTVSADTSAEPPSIIGDAPADSIVRLDVSFTPGLEASFAREQDGAWHMTVPTATTVISQTITNAVSGLISAGIQRSFAPDDNPLEAYGLLNPTKQVVIAESRGEQTIRHLIQVGSEAPTGDAYYVLREGDRRVHLVSKAALDTVFALASNPPLPESAATPLAP